MWGAFIFIAITAFIILEHGFWATVGGFLLAILGFLGSIFAVLIIWIFFMGTSDALESWDWKRIKHDIIKRLDQWHKTIESWKIKKDKNPDEKR